MGSSVGVENPYPTYPPPGGGEGCIGCGTSGLTSIDDNSVMMVNGAKVICSVNYATYDCGSMRNLAINGATIPMPLEKQQQNNPDFYYEYAGAGLFRYKYWVPGNDENKPLPPIAQVTRGHWESRLFSVSWSVTVRGYQQREEPKIPKNAPYSQNQMSALRDAYNEALDRLRNPDCAGLFTDWLLRFLDEVTPINHDAPPPMFDALEYEPSTVLRDITFRFLPLGSPVVNVDGSVGVVGAQTGSRTDVHINSQGPFLNRTIQVNGRNRQFDFGGRTTSLTQREFGALLLLHELGHAYGAVGDIMYFFGPDAADRARNLEHTQAIINACFPELNGSP